MSILMRNWIYIFVLFVGCSPEKIGPSENVAIFGLWEAGETPVIQALLLDGDQSASVPNQVFELVFQNGERSVFRFEGSEYVNDSQRVPEAGESLRLMWYRENDTAYVDIEMPPSITDVLVSNTTLSASGTDDCLVEWSMPEPGLECAFSMECLELQPNPLPWSPGNFSEQFRGPQVATELLLTPQSFSCYGSHALTISVLNDQLLDAFFFDLSDIRGLLKQGPDNVLGGKGFVAGVTKTKIILEIE
jgi:hypothetical protein